MKKVFCGTSGTSLIPETHRLNELPLRQELIKAFEAYYGKDLALRPAQDEAIFKYGLLSYNKNAIIATPTNSGKTLQIGRAHV